MRRVSLSFRFPCHMELNFESDKGGSKSFHQAVVEPSFVRIYQALLLLTLILIGLGSAVRTSNSGVSCPDWPLCFGQLIPDYHPEVYFEFIHRALAGVVGIITVAAQWTILRTKGFSRRVKLYSCFSLVLLAAQVFMGRQTVRQLLAEEVVTAHLVLGTSFFASLYWIYLQFPNGQQGVLSHQNRARMRWLILVPACFVMMQIVLGGLVASHYAGLVCPDFPLCHGKWVPTFQGAIGLQVIHRLGAYALVVVSLGVLAFLLFGREKKGFKESGALKGYLVYLTVLFLQVIVGIANVKFLTPPLITMIHLILAVSLVCLCLRAFHMARANSASEAAN